MSRRKPTAVERTISLFTGATDLDQPNARDGSGPAEPERAYQAAPQRRPDWHLVSGRLGEWTNGVWSIVHLPRAGTYELRKRGAIVSTHASILEATAAFEVARAAPGPKRGPT